MADGWLWAVIVLLILLIILLCVRIYIMKRSVREIEEGFHERLITGTNTLIDISCHDKDIKHLARSINKELKKLRSERHRFIQGDQELKNAITNIAHDLRTPLTAICGYLSLLSEEEKSAEVTRYLEVIENRVEVLKGLMEELFKYSVINGSKEKLVPEDVSLNAVLEESIAAYYAALTEKGITPVISMPEEKIVRRLDKAALSRIFANLLNNALKYSDGDLEITLESTGEIIFANTAASLGRVEVERMFDRFYTVENAGKSTGLGLSIAKKLTEDMNGIITADYVDKRLSIRINFDKI